MRRLRRRLFDRNHPFAALEKRLGFVFADPSLLGHALAHRSHVNAVGAGIDASNERLEFLGDAVLDLVVTDYLFRAHPDRQEGALSKIKSLVVSARVLAQCAQALDLGSHILLSSSEERSGGRDRVSILADAFESVIGALYLDGGYEAARRLIAATLLPRFEEFLADTNLVNYKSALLEYAQGRGWGAPRYEVRSTSGPEHDKKFHVTVFVKNQEWGRGSGLNKKDAEQAAARGALEEHRIPFEPEE